MTITPDTVPISTTEADQPKIEEPVVQDPDNRRALDQAIRATPEHGLELRSLDDFWRFAQFVHKSGFAPEGMDTPEKVLVAMQFGAEYGISAMRSLQCVAVINGTPSLWGDMVLAMCRSSGLFDESVFHEWFEGEGQKLVAHCEVRRLPNGKTIKRSFSMDDASRAGLLGRNTPWKGYPARMLQWKPRHWALRDTFTDVLQGVPIAEEIMTHDHSISEADEVPSDLDAVATKLESQQEEQPMRQDDEATHDANKDRIQKRADARRKKREQEKAKEELKPAAADEVTPDGQMF